MDNKKHLYLKLIIFVIILVLGMTLLMIRLTAFVRRSIHDERESYLSSQTDSVTLLVNKTIRQYMDYAQICARSVSKELNEGMDIYAFMDLQKDKLSFNDSRMILVDSNCTWYAAGGMNGRITDIESYQSNTSQSLIYMTIGVDTDIESIVYRVRLDSPISVSTPSGNVTIEYCAIIYYMNYLEAELASSFPYNCNSFIVDQTGLMVYKNYQMGQLIRGSNIFTKYLDTDFLYIEDSSTLIDKIKSKMTVVSEFIIDKSNFFICTSPLDVNNWYISFVINANELIAGSYVRTIFLYMLAMGLLFAFVIILAVISAIKIIDDRKRIALEKQTNLMLEKTSRAKTEFMSNMSHDIRTPINGIMGMTAIALRNDNPDETNKCLNKIDTSSKYLLSLVNDVLDMSALESGMMTFSEGTFDLLCFLDESCGIVSSQIEDKHIELINDFSGIKHAHVIADEQNLRRIIINILGNAVKFTPEGGRITITADELEFNDGFAKYRLEIADTGIGMSSEFISRIWDRFSQETSGSRSEFKGTGLGMAITKKIVDALGGTISVESKVGEGSKFIVELSLKLSEDKEYDQVISDLEADLTGRRILVVEDNEINLEIAITLLEDAGAICDSAMNGKDAVDKFLESEIDYYDIVLMDVMMPVMDGIEAVKRIRGLDRNDAKLIPVIAMTANTLESDIKACIDAGMDAYIAKPIDIRNAKICISQNCRKRGQ